MIRAFVLSFRFPLPSFADSSLVSVEFLFLHPETCDTHQDEFEQGDHARVANLPSSASTLKRFERLSSRRFEPE